MSAWLVKMDYINKKLRKKLNIKINSSLIFGLMESKIMKKTKIKMKKMNMKSKKCIEKIINLRKFIKIKKILRREFQY